MQSFRLFQRTATFFSNQNALFNRPTSSKLFFRHYSSSPLFNALGRNFSRPSLRHLLRNRRPYSSKPDYNPTPNLNSPRGSSTESGSLSFSQRMRKLSREYGWSAFGVYMALSALDFPFCFLAVRTLGTDRIGRWEHAAVDWIKNAIPVQWPAKYGGQAKQDEVVEEAVGGVTAGYDHGVREADRENKGDNASIWTQLALAYAIHKSFIFIRVPLTAAVTPKVVKVLRGWGYNIGKRTPKAERLAVKAQRAADKTTN